MNKDSIIREWFYRLPNGYATAPYSEKEMNVLHEVLTENGMNGSIFAKEAKLEINIAWSLLERFYWVNNLKRKAELHNKNIWDYWNPYNKLKWNIISWTLIEA